MIKEIDEKFILFTKDGKKKLGEFATRSEAVEKEKDIVSAERVKAIESLRSGRQKRGI